MFREVQNLRKTQGLEHTKEEKYVTRVRQNVDCQYEDEVPTT